MQIVIVGGDAAGMSAASQIRRRKPEVKVIVLEKSHDVSFGACGMPFNLADPARDMNDVVVMQADTFINKRGIDLRLGHEVTKVMPEDKIVQVKTAEFSYELSYDKLIYATGASPLIPPIRGIDSDKVLYFHSLESARKLKSLITDLPSSRFAVVGAGLIGLEVAEALIKRGMDVTIIEKLPKPLPFLGDAISSKLASEIQQNNISSYFGTSLKEIIEKDGKLKLTLDDDNRVSVDYLIMTVGVKPNSKLLLDAGIKAGARSAVAINEYLFTSDEHILSAGDCADAFHAVNNQRVYVPLALRANRAGKLAGANAVGFNFKIPPINGTAGIRFFNLEISWTGLTEETAKESEFEPVTKEITANSKAHAFPGGGKIIVRLTADKKSGRLLGGAFAGPKDSTALRVDVVSAALHHKADVSMLGDYDLVYSPPFGPTWSPVLLAASQLQKLIS